MSIVSVSVRVRGRVGNAGSAASKKTFDACFFFTRVSRRATPSERYNSRVVVRNSVISPRASLSFPHRGFRISGHETLPIAFISAPWTRGRRRRRTPQVGARRRGHQNVRLRDPHGHANRTRVFINAAAVIAVVRKHAFVRPDRWVLVLRGAQGIRRRLGAVSERLRNRVEALATSSTNRCGRPSRRAACSTSPAARHARTRVLETCAVASFSSNS